MAAGAPSVEMLASTPAAAAVALPGALVGSSTCATWGESMPATTDRSWVTVATRRPLALPPLPLALQARTGAVSPLAGPPMVLLALLLPVPAAPLLGVERRASMPLGMAPAPSTSASVVTIRMPVPLGTRPAGGYVLGSESTSLAG